MAHSKICQNLRMWLLTVGGGAPSGSCEQRLPRSQSPRRCCRHTACSKLTVCVMASANALERSASRRHSLSPFALSRPAFSKATTCIQMTAAVEKEHGSVAAKCWQLRVTHLTRSSYTLLATPQDTAKRAFDEVYREVQTTSFPASKGRSCRRGPCQGRQCKCMET